MSSRALFDRRSAARFALALAGCLAAGAMVYVALFGSFAFNMTHSLKGTAYLTFDHWPPESGFVAVFEAPKGFDPDIPFLKRIAGGPGDLVEVDKDTRIVSVAGQEIGYGREMTEGGDPLDLIDPGVIPAGHYFMAGEAADSFDSRFAWVGLIPEAQIRAVGFELSFIPRSFVFGEADQ